MTQTTPEGYGFEDTSYQAAGCLDGLTRLVDMFYHYVDTLPEAKVIRKLYPEDLSLPKQKLAYFLSGWLGGPRIYQQHFKPISIPGAHSHMNIGIAERDAWLFCMQKAVEEQPFADSFKIYLMDQLAIPAERIRQVCELRKSSD